MQLVIHDDAVVVVDNLALVTELDGFPQPALGDRPGIAVVQADHPGRAIGSPPGDPLPGLLGDLGGGFQQVRQVVDGAGQPTTPAPRGGIPHACLGQLSCFDLRAAPALLLGKLAAYVLGERPRSGDDHLFLRSVAPHTRLGDHATVHRVTVETFRKAGVTDVKAGTRLLRHNAASRLLAAAVPRPTISAVLGHASEESTNLYMSVDRLRLLDCVLPVPEAVQR
jgi:hypothetical protein